MKGLGWSHGGKLGQDFEREKIDKERFCFHVLTNVNGRVYKRYYFSENFIMKNKLFLFVLLVSLNTNAQKPKRISFYVGGGYLSEQYLKQAVLKKISSKENSHKHICILLNAGFKYPISKKINSGVNISYDHFGLEDRSTEINLLSLMLRGEYIWHETSRILLYSGGAAGVSSGNKKEDGKIINKDWSPAYQIYLLGLGLKNSNTMLDFSLGYGTTGILNFHIQYKF